jgi:hypothetical protein
MRLLWHVHKSLTIVCQLGTLGGGVTQSDCHVEYSV